MFYFFDGLETKRKRTRIEETKIYIKFDDWLTFTFLFSQ